MPSADHIAPAWSFRNPARSPLFRFFAHILIRLLIVTPLPEPLQVAAALFPVSMLWGLVRVTEPVQDRAGKVGLPGSEEPVQTGPSESLGVGCVGSKDRTRQESLGGLASITGGAPLRLFKAGTLTNIGSRMALTDDGILVSTDRVYVSGVTTSENGVHTAALGSIALIRDVVPPVVPVDADGKTLQPVRVRYQLLAPPELAAGKMHLIRSTSAGNETLASYPVSDLTDGTFWMTIPAGVVLQTPPEEVTIRLVKPDGTRTAPFITTIRNPEGPETSSGGIISQPGVLSGLSPDHASRGAGDVTVTASGTNLASLATVYMRDTQGEWQELETQSHSSTQATFIIPQALLQQEGFLQVSATASDEAEDSLAFMVAAPGLPAPGTATGITISSVYPTDLGGERESLLSLSGSGFAEGATLVLGRAGVPGIVLSTEWVNETVLEGTLPALFVGSADNLFVAVLSPDGSALSSPVPLTSTKMVPPTIADEELYDAGDVGITSIEGDIVWNHDGQELEIKGVNLAVGMQVEFVTHKNGQESVFSAPLRPGSFKVTVPKQVYEYPWFGVVFEGTPKAKINPIKTTTYFFAPEEPLAVPLGGRIRLVAYYSSIAKATQTLLSPLFPFAPPPPIVLAAPVRSSLKGLPTGKRSAQLYPESLHRPCPRKLLPGLELATDVTFSVTNDRPDRRGRPSVQAERESDDAQALYVRGISLSDDPGYQFADPPVGPEKRDPATITVQWPSGSVPVPVAVVERALGIQCPEKAVDCHEHNSDIVKAANYYGVPPQFLKGQVEQESGFRTKNYHYEPMSIDFFKLSGDGTMWQGRSPRVKSVMNGSKRWVNSAPFQPYAIEGALLDSNADTQQTTPLSLAAEDAEDADNPRVFFLGVQPVRARDGLPREQRHADLSVTIEGDAQPLTHVLDRKTWTRDGGLHAADALCAHCFAVDYDTGFLRLGTSLGEGELHVSFKPLLLDSSRASDGTHITGSEPPTWVTPQNPNGVLNRRNLHFDQTWNVGQFLEENAKYRNDPKWLVCEAGECAIEFYAGADNKQATPLDPRFKAVQGQFFAAASYGPLQVTLLEWGRTDGRPSLLNTVLNPQDEPLYRVNRPDQWTRGVALAGVVHGANVRQLNNQQGTPGPALLCASCSSSGWERKWNGVLVKYNGKATYGTQVISRSRKHEPF